MSKYRIVTREDISGFSRLLSGYIDTHFLADWDPIENEEIDALHDFICKRIGMYLPIKVK